MNRIKELRLERGMTLEELAAEVGCTLQAVSCWERGQTLPTADRLPQLAKALGCTIDDLFREETAAQDEINMEGTA